MRFEECALRPGGNLEEVAPIIPTREPQGFYTAPLNKGGGGPCLCPHTLSESERDFWGGRRESSEFGSYYWCTGVQQEKGCCSSTGPPMVLFAATRQLEKIRVGATVPRVFQLDTEEAGRT